MSDAADDACVPAAAGEICNGADDDCDGVADDSACPPDGTGFTSEDGTVYVFLAGAVPQAQAAATCASLGMGLVAIESRAEHDFVFQIVAGGVTAWIAATDAELNKTWRWSAGGPVFWIGDADGAVVDGAFNFWFPAREPNNAGGAEDCAAMNADDPEGEWSDLPCEIDRAAVCELG